MSIFLFIVVLFLLVIVHELGHFIAAKKAGIRVDEFGVGFPPRLYKKKIRETVYSFNLFPVGGFVKIFGENPDEESIHGHDSKRSFVHKSKLIQAWVVSAGIIFNVFFAYILISLGFMVGMPHSADDERYGARVEHAELTIDTVRPDSPAARAGLQAGDHIVALSSAGDALEQPGTLATQEFIATHKDITLSYVRDREFHTVSVNPEIIPGVDHPVIGISMENSGILRLPIHEALYAGLITTASITWATITGLTHFFFTIFAGQANFESVTGPVGIVNIVHDASDLGFAYLVSLTALISINLAVINILPFPALDGGRLLFIIIEAIKGSRIKPAVVNSVNGIGFILLIILMIVVTYHDIARLITG